MFPSPTIHTTLRRCRGLVLVVAIIGLLGYRTRPWSMVDQQMLLVDKNVTSHRPKLILAWTGFFGEQMPEFGRGREAMERLGCEVSNCEMSEDKGRAEEADAIIFHVRDFKWDEVPRVRRTSQRYVFFLLESPVYTGLDLTYFSNFFNWTMTYRRDSDIHFPYYGSMSDLSYDPSKDYMGNRHSGTGSQIAWVVSNCYTQSQREYLVELLRNKFGLRIDVFGKCGQPPLACGEKNVSNSCPDIIASRYLFYLALENSLCRDYVTEKFFNYIHRDIIVITLSGADYSALVPEGAVITIRPDTSLSQLAHTINTLSHDRQAYNNHFMWRRHFKAKKARAHPWCQMCARLNNAEEEEKVYENIHGWWTDDTCLPTPYWRFMYWYYLANVNVGKT